MSEIRRNSGSRTAAAVDEYLRALGRAARDQAVAEAEQEVCRVWAEELSRVQHVTELGVASAHAASQAAQILVREEQRIGDLDGLARAQNQLERAEHQERRSGEAARVLLNVVTEELELLAIAAEDRETVALANRIWLSSAGRAVCAAEADEGVDSGMSLDAADFDD
ncbi:MAG TPA: hypothetical protein VFU74_22930 [Actinocrinis sp.]|nr:hypothetical protein [Actinocrinis sp.]